MFCNNKKKKMLHFQKKQNMRNSIKKNIPFYVMFIPVLIYFVIFRYVPLLLSLIISLEKYQPAKGIFSSKWVGIEYYKQFINSVFFWRLIRNTLGINFLQLTVGFVAPIILALLLNEVGRMRYKKLVQTVSYPTSRTLPIFIKNSNTIVGVNPGNVMLNSCAHLPAPSILAASYNSELIPVNEAR